MQIPLNALSFSTLLNANEISMEDRKAQGALNPSLTYSFQITFKPVAQIAMLFVTFTNCDPITVRITFERPDLAIEFEVEALSIVC